nr:SMEK domain-containing protein [uncultured Dysosmobacter sp.]
MKSTFDHISEKWELLKRRVSQHNAHGLTDLAQHCEDIVGQIFHILYDLSLQNLNRQTPHFPSVDLVDPARGIYLQVTTQ